MRDEQRVRIFCLSFLHPSTLTVLEMLRHFFNQHESQGVLPPLLR
jgi:hypothetical protein